jgi:hypothetical protein
MKRHPHGRNRAGVHGCLTAHRDLDQRPPNKADVEVAELVPIDKIRRRPILGGLINQYDHTA